MKATSIVLPLIFLVFTAASAAQDKPGTEAVDRFVLTKVRLLPKPGTAGLLAGIAHGISLPRRAADCAYRCDGNWTWVSDRMTWKLALVW